MELMQAVEHYATAMKLAERYGNKNGDVDAANNAWYECKKAADTLTEMREALRYLMQRFDEETWQCPNCGHSEDTATMDSAEWLRDWLNKHNEPNSAGAEGAPLE